MSTQLTIDLAEKTITATGVMAIRELVSVTLVNIGGSLPANLILTLSNGDEIIAQCQNFTNVGGNIIGYLDLSVENALAVFQPTDPPLWVRSLYLTLWDGSSNSLLANDVASIQNNVFVEG